ncbi:glycosyltransferase [Halobacterium sp. MBLA0001]|uniref:glycosyltransferase n=1 Tax=Halobacterium sp. MBLA0001 TaxID=3413511 RepID=UPI003C768BFB
MTTDLAFVSLGQWSSVWEQRIDHISDHVGTMTVYRATDENPDFDIPDNVEFVDVVRNRRTPLIPLYSIICIVLILYRELIDETNHNVIHSIDYYGGPLCAITVGNLLSIRSIISMRGLPKQATPEYAKGAKSSNKYSQYLFYMILIFYYKYVLPLADVVHFKSESEIEYLCGDCGINIRRAEIIPTGVDIELFDNRSGDISFLNQHLSKMDINDIKTKETILYAGRISEGKGILELLNHHKNIDKDINLLIVGIPTGSKGGEIQGEIISRASNYDSIKHIDDFIDHENIPSLIQTCDYVTLLSTYRTEGAPRIIQESLILGTPCIISDMPGVCEPFNDISGCEVIDPVSSHQFEQSLSNLDDQRVNKDVAKERFDMAKNYQRLSELYYQN